MDVYFTNLGCKLNQAEIEALAREFTAAGHRVVGSLAEAEIHVINSCTVTHVAARSSRKLARRGSRLGSRVRTVLTGCYASGSPGEAARLAGVDLVVPNAEKGELLARVHQAFPEAVPVLPRLPEAAPPGPCWSIEGGHTRAMVKISDGCNMRCSFCIIPFTRGQETSRPVGDVVAEVRALCAEGFREVVLTGVQITHWRVGELRLYDLARAVLDETPVERLRLTSIAPWDWESRLLEIFRHPRVCRHVHLSLQSGSTATLVRMRRPYSAEGFAGVMAELRQGLPGVAVTTDVIVGFPGETAEEFADSLAFVRRAGFARVHVFPYSPRQGTAAAELPGQVPHGEKRERMGAMLAVAEEARAAFARAHLGETVSVLWERREDSGLWMGLTDQYLRAHTTVPEGTQLRNRITPLRVTALGEGEGVVGELPGSGPG